MFVVAILVAALLPFVTGLGTICWFRYVREQDEAAQLAVSVVLGLAGGLLMGTVVSAALIFAVLVLIRTRG